MDIEYCYECLDLPMGTLDLPTLRAAFRMKVVEFHPAVHEEGKRGAAIRNCKEAKHAYDSLLQHILEKRENLAAKEEITEAERDMVEEDACIRSEILKLMYHNLIEEAQFPYGCPSHAPGKGLQRPWKIDYSIIQEQCCANMYPVPSAEIFKDERFGTDFKVFSVVWIACTADFWPVPLSKDDRSATAFCTPDGHFFNWLLISRCLPHADALMQRRVETALGGTLMNSCCVARLDRVLVFSQTAEDHMDKVKQVTKKLKNMGLRVDANKSGFGFNWEGAQQILQGLQPPTAKQGDEESDPEGKLSETDPGQKRVLKDEIEADASIREDMAPKEAQRKRKKSVTFAENIVQTVPEKRNTKEHERSEEDLEAELERIKEEKRKLRRKMKGKYNSCWEVMESPVFMVFAVQVAMALGYWYYSEYNA